MASTCRGSGDGEPREESSNGTPSPSSADAAQSVNSRQSGYTAAADGPNRPSLAVCTSTAPAPTIMLRRWLMTAIRIVLLVVGCQLGTLPAPPHQMRRI